MNYEETLMNMALEGSLGENCFIWNGIVQNRQNSKI